MLVGVSPGLGVGGGVVQVGPADGVTPLGMIPDTPCSCDGWCQAAPILALVGMILRIAAAGKGCSLHM